MLPPLLLKRIGACWILKLWHDVTTHAYSLFLVSTIVECVFIINAIILKLETCYMLNIGNYEMHIPPSQKHTVHCIELGILPAVAYLSSLHPQESSKMPKKTSSTRRYPSTKAGYQFKPFHIHFQNGTSLINVSNLSSMSTTHFSDNISQHWTKLLVFIGRSPNTMSLMLLWKDWGLSLKKWVSWENATIMQLSRKSSGGSGNAAAAGKKNTKKGKKGSTHCLQ